MKILFRLLTLFLTVPVIELALLLQVSRWTGFWPTVALIALTAIAGSYLAKREGLSAWNRLQGRLGEGGLPGDELLDAVIILIAGAFLITPGVLTDFVGFTGLIPLTRRWIRQLVKRRLKKAMREGRLQTSFGTFGGAFETRGSSTTASEETATGPSSPNANASHVGGTPSKRGPSPTAGATSPHGNGQSPSPSDPAENDPAENDDASAPRKRLERSPDSNGNDDT